MVFEFPISWAGITLNNSKEHYCKFKCDSKLIAPTPQRIEKIQQRPFNFANNAKISLNYKISSKMPS